jgi:hypothetical protein
MAAVTAPSSVRASLKYIKDLELYQHEKPYMADIDDIPVNQRSNIQLESREVTVQNARGQNFTIEQHSFEFVSHEHEIPSNDASLEPYIETTSLLLQDRFKADKVICYDSLVSLIFPI